MCKRRAEQVVEEEEEEEEEEKYRGGGEGYSRSIELLFSISACLVGLAADERLLSQLLVTLG
jgi:hypothetical protein